MPATITFDAAAFRAFLASKPAAEPYDFENNQRCPIAQYVKSQTPQFVSCGTEFASVFTDNDFHSHKIPAGWSNAMIGDERHPEGLRGQWTWGGALKRFDHLMMTA